MTQLAAQMSACWLMVALTAWGEEPKMDATVETTSGASTHLAPLFNKPTVLFYEDKDSTALNQHVKEALARRGQALGLNQRVGVVAVANVAAFDWFPARNFVLAAVRGAEEAAHVPVYLDFKGSFAAPPWNLAATSSTVLVLSAQGTVLWKARGKLSDAQLGELFEALNLALKNPVE